MCLSNLDSLSIIGSSVYLGNDDGLIIVLVIFSQFVEDWLKLFAVT